MTGTYPRIFAMRSSHLAGVRFPALHDRAGCAVCGSPGAPAIIWAAMFTGEAEPPKHVRLCLPCVGRAVEEATGWKVMRAWSQWLASSVQAANNRVTRPGTEGTS